MDRIKWTSFIVLTTGLVLVIQLLIVNLVMAQAPNKTLPQNPNTTKLIMNLKNHTITVVDTRTNETIGVMNLTPKPGANMTANETLTTNAGNTTTNENLTPENTTINETLTKNTGNATTNVNLTAKFNALQNK
jgi:hypothetical protein